MVGIEDAFVKSMWTLRVSFSHHVLKAFLAEYKI